MKDNVYVTSDDAAYTIRGGGFTLVDRGPQKLSFVNGEGSIMFSILPDGSIERGPAFTTDDQASLLFWECVERFRPKGN